MNHPVASALIPVVLLIAVGFLAGKRQWIGAAAIGVIGAAPVIGRALEQCHPGAAARGGQVDVGRQMHAVAHRQAHGEAPHALGAGLDAVPSCRAGRDVFVPGAPST